MTPDHILSVLCPKCYVNDFIYSTITTAKYKDKAKQISFLSVSFIIKYKQSLALTTPEQDVLWESCFRTYPDFRINLSRF